MVNTCVSFSLDKGELLDWERERWRLRVTKGVDGVLEKGTT